jgi:hypothetical protein
VDRVESEKSILHYIVNMEQYVNGLRHELKLIAYVENYTVQPTKVANSYRQQNYSPTCKRMKLVINNETPDETKTSSLVLQQLLTKTEHQ